MSRSWKLVHLWLEFQKERRERKEQKQWQRIFTKLTEDIKPQIQEELWTIRINLKEITFVNIIIKLLKDKDKIFLKVGEKNTFCPKKQK